MKCRREVPRIEAPRKAPDRIPNSHYGRTQRRSLVLAEPEVPGNGTDPALGAVKRGYRTGMPDRRFQPRSVRRPVSSKRACSRTPPGRIELVSTESRRSCRLLHNSLVYETNVRSHRADHRPASTESGPGARHLSLRSREIPEGSEK